MNRMQTSAYNNGYDRATEYFNKAVLPMRLRQARIRFTIIGFSAGLAVAVLLQGVLS